MAVNKLTGLDQYADLLATHPDEVDSLYQDILIMVTDFFREPAAFEALREQALPRLLLDRPPGAPLRVWVPGCASGEEAYSIAIELVEYLHDHRLSHPFKLFATDINERDIAHARRHLRQRPPGKRAARLPATLLRGRRGRL